MFEEFRHVHIIGVGGIGTSAIAKLFLAKGARVTGSDRQASALTDELVRHGLRFAEGGDPSALATADLVVYSAAVPDTDPERAEAARLGVRQLSYPQFLGELSRGYTTIAVAGTNGKSTVTAMLGLLLEAAGYDPLVIVGSLVPGFSDGNLRLGAGRFLVVEACEYRAHMLNLHPEMIVLTNVEEDHLDYFRDLAHIQDTFQTFLDKMKGKGLVVLNADDPGSAGFHADRVVRYGTQDGADYMVENRRTAAGIQSALVRRLHPPEPLGDLALRVPGAFNIMNALAATAAAMELGVPFETCARVLKQFPGIWRRFERVGTWNGADVISDYGHHPTAIRATVAAAREFFPGRRVVLCFQPHQHARTKELFGGFVEALAEADAVVVPEVYEVAGRTEDDAHVSSQQLADAVKKRRPATDVRYAADLRDARAMLSIVARPGDVILVQGAGDVDALARGLVGDR